MKRKDFKEVDFEDYEQKEGFICAMKSASELGLIDYDWEGYEEDNIIKSVWLRQDAIDTAYKAISRASKYDKSSLVIDALSVLDFINYEWMSSLKSDVIEKFNKTKTVTPILFDDVDRCLEMLKLLSFLDIHIEERLHERLISVKLYNDSKHFQKHLKGKLLSLVRKYTDINEDTVALASVGITHNPETIEWCGPLRIKLNGCWLDFGVFETGAIINADSVTAIESLMPDEVTKVTFIENRGTYDHYKKHRAKSELVIYHGGFAGLKKQQFYRVLYDTLPDAAYQHWSDIDLGGFRIFVLLKQIIPTLSPYKMDIETLKEAEGYWMSISKEYIKQLALLLDRQSYEVFHDLIHYMLVHNCRLEQEAIGLSSDDE